jgi:hypothetical protein
MPASSPCQTITPSTASGLLPRVMMTRPSGLNLTTHIRSLIDSPDIVVRIDADDMSKREAIQIIADLPDKFPGLIEFKEPRFTASGENQNVSFGVLCHPTASPRYKPVGSFKKLGTESKVSRAHLGQKRDLRREESLSPSKIQGNTS